MAHEIATTNGRPAVAYFGATPWHGLGTELTDPATAAEAITVAGLNYEVGLAPLMTADGTPVVQRKAVVRGDTKQVLGVVGNSYIPIQNSEAFEFLDTVVADGGLRYHTAGALGNAITEYVDHHRPTRARTIEERTSRRLQSQWFGSGAQLKAKAWNLALQMANSN